jgi:hypothetical protein
MGHVATRRRADESSVSAGHVHGLRDAAVGYDGVRRERSNVLPLFILVIGLAAATAWFVALPLLDRPQQAERGCEVFVLPSGTVKCVPTAKAGSAAKSSKPKASRRAKR